MKKLLLLTMALGLLISGCASLNPITPFKGNQIMINPITGDQQICKYRFISANPFEVGLLSSNLAFSHCIEDWQSKGYILKDKN